MLSNQEIAHRFGYHKPQDDIAQVHRDLRVEYKKFAEKLELTLPDGRAKAAAFTALEEASMWSHKSVAEQSPLSDD